MKIIELWIVIAVIVAFVCMFINNTSIPYELGKQYKYIEKEFMKGYYDKNRD